MQTLGGVSKRDTVSVSQLGISGTCRFYCFPENLSFLPFAKSESSRTECFTDAEGLICQALLLGNTEAAVELCLQNGRMADAIILAMTGGSDLLAKTQYRYFQVMNFITYRFSINLG